MSPVNRNILLFVVCVGLLSGCGGRHKRGGYYEGDGPPKRSNVDIDAIPDARPTGEGLSRYGNKTYSVNGKTYHPIRSARHYKERGVASWYGKKFHGRRTSNGEVYDMYRMSAAHRTLPLPSFLRVTNLANARSVVVRVNDRGPFYDNRLIDLSYAAAHRIGVLATGTALVELQGVSGESNAGLESGAPRSLDYAGGAPQLYLQVGAFISRANAERLRLRLEQAQLGPVVIQMARSGARKVHRVRIGPLNSVTQGDDLAEKVSHQGFVNARLVVE
ncbi:MAG TPA: septal ring lytic transglycosylase RlpA family protein [Acidiferrobacteraceae bacterium]|nr:septal ring lytic transglycosylase RlpA family protein [Acidiferrobacteraceae bacterium]